MSVAREQGTAQRFVCRILERYKSARNSDSDLIMRFWYAEGLMLTQEQIEWIIQKGTKAETITRARRKIQEDKKDKKTGKIIQFGQFKSDKQIERARKMREQEHRSFFGGGE